MTAETHAEGCFHVTVRILKGDCRDVLRELEPESVHCVVTSPPYWGLRDYGVAGQLGMEGSLGGHIEAMRNVFAQDKAVRLLSEALGKHG